LARLRMDSTELAPLRKGLVKQAYVIVDVIVSIPRGRYPNGELAR